MKVGGGKEVGGGFGEGTGGRIRDSGKKKRK